MKKLFKNLLSSDSWSKHFSETVKRMGKNNAGFSLVELIVVIAIMAILAAVAVVGVSVYIPKAQQANDKQLVSDIEDILLYESYAGTFEEGEGGYIILTTNGITNTIEENSALDIALKNAYGSDYKSTLKLAYEEWGSNGLSDGLVGLMAEAVKDSSYMKGNRVDSLLGDVEKMTGMAQNLVTSLSTNAALKDMTLSQLFTADVLNETGKKYGIGEDDWTAADWDAWGQKPENKVAYGNLLVLAAADDIENHKADENYSDASGLIMEFSSYYAFAAQNEAFSKVLDEKLDALQSVDGTTAGQTWYADLESKAIAAGYDVYKYKLDENGDPVLDEDGNRVLTEQYMKDKAAFGTVMAGLGNPSEDQASILAGDLNNANLFTSGVGNDMYNEYMDLVEISHAVFGETMDGMTIPAGGVAIMFVQTAEGVIITNSLVADK